MLGRERPTGSISPAGDFVEAPLRQPVKASNGVYGDTGEGLPPAEFANCPEPKDTTEKHPVSRRTILKCAGFAALGLMVAGKTVSELGGIYEKEHWPNNPPEFTNGTPELPTTGGNEVILFGGFGEYDTTDYAQGLGKKIKAYARRADIQESAGPIRTVGFRYPAQGYKVGDIGEALYEHLRAAKPEKVALDLTSMGAETGLTAFSWVNENKKDLDKQWAAAHGTKPDDGWEIPPVSLIAANGSPAGLENAAMEDVVRFMLFLHETTGYTPGIGAEWLYECLDDQNGWEKTLGLHGVKAAWEQIVDGFHRTIDGFPPDMTISQGKALEEFKREQIFNNLRGCVGAFTTFCYMNAKDWQDGVVDERASSADLIKSAKSIGISNIKIVSTGMPYHASHWGADRYLPEIIHDAFSYTHNYLTRQDSDRGPSISA